jgi:peptide/nickel transport system substrate-binding protein
MTRARLGVAVTLMLLVSACTGGGDNAPTPPPSSPHHARGGTLRVILPHTPFPIDALIEGEATALDPQGEYFVTSEELFRCCLTRTLLSYNGQSTELGGAVLRPDLAASLPSISPDGLTWTFRLRRGIHYAPPLQGVEITTRDVVRGIERAVASKGCPGCYGFRFSDIVGVEDFTAGRAAHISGLETPDAHTLVVHLTAPAGDLGNRLASVATAPIPPSPADPSSPFGVATGHDEEYGRFLVASGPYMVEGSAAMDFSMPAGQQQPAAGFVPGRSITLVRNPSWRAASDALRPAYPDRIDIAIGGTLEEGSAKVDAGTADVVLYPAPPPQAPLDQIRRYQSDPKLRPSLHIHSRDFARLIAINTAQPPFDDVHVRKALNYVIDKQRLLDLRGGRAVGEIAGHIVLNSLENNLLVDYDPYRTEDRADALSKAKAEMRQSGYDADHDGECDAEACRHVTGLSTPLFAELTAPIAEDLRRIGIHATITATDTIFDDLGKPKNHIALAVNIGFFKDYLNASPNLVPFISSSLSDEASPNYSLLGATPQQLRRWGYPVRSVPSIDAKFRQCVPLVGQAQFQCWAELDQLLMEQVVPAVPLVFEGYVRPVSARVASYSFDQSVALPALDQIALKPGSD